MDHNTKRGKWSVPGVPHIGWKNINMEDLGDDMKLCMMCESSEIRYAHHMEHPEYNGTLMVGCICAQHMEDNYKDAQKREKILKNVTRRRETWARKRWKLSNNGNWYLKIEGYVIVLIKMSKNYSIRVKNAKNDRTIVSPNKYDTLERAKDFAFNALVWAKENLI